ncbi:aftiphilin-like [Hippocampus comes]|uniref:aftiphilin-like n=1 Tax=Hippocampus comes TaxID=109280 RepID=UPI00094E038A|nr:PREDICTED: aftiphilin-like [Hippocampus comes]
MEPDVMRLYSSSPPPMEDAEEDDDQDDFGDFGAFSTASAGDGFGEPDAPGHASFATSPPELLNGLPAAEERVDVLGAPAGGGGDNGRASDTETETSLGRPPSTEAPEDYGDVSTTGSAQSPPPLREENATPADHSQLDDDDEEFGDFGDPPPARDRFGDLDGPRPDADGEGGASFADARWSAFGEESEGESWAAFRSEAAAPAEAPWSRVEKLLEASFPLRDGAPPAAEGRVASLKTLVEARQDDAGSALGGGGVWRQLRDIHEAVGLGHQWGGSYCNKTLLGCLGIDTRNIVRPPRRCKTVVCPQGMLEPTKEPAKPVSAAEMIASIAQAAAAAPDGATCPSDVVVVQEPLPPVRFDWSSSGLTNPLDASGGSFLLNLDFFGPVDDSGSSCSPAIPGVDPELVELTTAKMEPGGGGGGAAGGRVVDAFARLMSTMDKTSTSTR